MKATAKDGGVRIEIGSEIETAASIAYNLGLALSDSAGLRQPSAQVELIINSPVRQEYEISANGVNVNR